jgi:N-sulfoglucosamine sulfohydrolase
MRDGEIDMTVQPNILLLITHDTGRHLGSFDRGLATPNLDRLAREGVVFERAFCAAPQCSPSRGSLITGQMPHTHGLIGLAHLGFRLNAAGLRRALPSVLAAAGYDTRLFGFQHEAGDPSALGYRQVAGDPSGRSAEVASAAIAFLAGRPAQPFFASVGLAETHRPFAPTVTPLTEVKVPAYLPDTPATRRDVADLNGETLHADAAIGQILNALDVAGLSRQTLVVYTPDHGIAFPRAKGTLFDPGIEIGMIARGPGGFEGGRRIAGLVSNIDLYPTILRLCNVSPPDGTQGVDLAPLLNGSTTSVRDEIFAELTFHTAYDPMRGLRTLRHKYIRSFAERPLSLAAHVDPSPTKDLLRDQGYFNQPRPREMLFDLHTDPLEQINLAGDPAHAVILTSMQARLDRWMEETGDPLRHGDIAPPPGAIVTPPGSYEPTVDGVDDPTQEHA